VSLQTHSSSRRCDRFGCKTLISSMRCKPSGCVWWKTPGAYGSPILRVLLTDNPNTYGEVATITGILPGGIGPTRTTHCNSYEKT
jgi:hypothetical protein